jgi:nickel/cobalt transporter (NicO) family protein
MFAELVGYLVTTATIAAMHAALPTHWLPFALVGRSQKWPVMKTVLITMLAGLGHVSMTALIGFLTAWVGMGMHRVAERFSHQLGGWVLIIFGMLYAVFDLRHLGHRHAMDVDFSDTTAVMSFVTMLTVSPCIALIPIFFAVSSIGWRR